MNVFAALIEPPKSRPGDPLPASLKALLPPPKAERVRGKAYLPHRPNKWDLSPSEAFVLDRSAQGFTQRDIARQLSVGFSTINTHVANLKKKMGAMTLTQAAVLWVREMGEAD